MLTQHGLASDFNENTVLKGGISNYKYVWCSENSDKTCEKCAELDGQEFDFEDEIPERPHPNCKCTVRYIEIPTGDNPPKPQPKEEEEPCDCWEQIDALVEEADFLEQEANIIILDCINLQNESKL